MRTTASWTKDGQTAVIDVDKYGCVLVAYEVLASLLAELGWTVSE